MKKEKELFYEIRHMKNKLDNMSTFVQNEFERCLKDKIYTKKTIKKMKEEFEFVYKEFLKQLNEWNENVKELMEFYGKN